MKKIALLLSFIALAVIITACGGNGDTEEPQTKSGGQPEQTAEASIGVGPVKELHLEALDGQLATDGKTVFEAKCTACHKIEARHVGPAIAGITERREPEWIMNMILNPEVMVKEDETAKQLLAEYLSPMANQGLTEDEARAVLEYFRQIDTQ